MQYLKVKNWERFQHYKSAQPDSVPVWIKLHRSLLADYEFQTLPDVAKGHLMMIWLFASQAHGRIPNNPKWVGEKIGANSKVDLGALVDAGFLIIESILETALERISEPLLSRGEESREREDEDLDPSSSELPKSAPSEAEVWGKDLWLVQFLKEQTAFNGQHLPTLIDHSFWCDVSEVVNGVNQRFLTQEFAKMGLWLRDHPQRHPTVRGARRFVAGWLERAYEKERRYGTTNPQRPR